MIAVLATAGLSLLATSAASAAKPTREPFTPLEFEGVSLFCGFPVTVETISNNTTRTTFADGRVVFTGSLKSRVTNDATGESLVVREGGSVLVLPDREILRGRILHFGLPQDVTGAGLFLLVGRADNVLQPGTPFSASLTVHGKQIDLCNALSS